MSSSATTTAAQPGMLHHIEIYVANLARSAQFWGEFLEWLGWAPFQSWDKGRSWLLHSTYIVFVQAEEEFLGHGYHRKRVGLNHLAFHVAGDAFDTTVHLLLSLGATLLYPEQHPYAGGPDYKAAFFEDPDRIKIEIVPL